MYSWAKQQNVILICGHSHRAIFASRSRMERLPGDIAKLKAKLSMDHELTAKDRENIYIEIDQKERELEEEKERGRTIEPTDPTRIPKPCYFNTGCGLYSNGITALEIADNKIKLVKWSVFGDVEVYVEDGLSEIVDKIVKE